MICWITWLVSLQRTLVFSILVRTDSSASLGEERWGGLSCHFLKTKILPWFLENNVLIVFIYWLNFSFKMLRVSRRKVSKVFPCGLTFVCCRRDSISVFLCQENFPALEDSRLRVSDSRSFKLHWHWKSQLIKIISLLFFNKFSNLSLFDLGL